MTVVQVSILGYELILEMSTLGFKLSNESKMPFICSLRWCTNALELRPAMPRDAVAYQLWTYETVTYPWHLREPKHIQRVLASANKEYAVRYISIDVRVQ